jgi:hypothetical protein
MTLTKTYLDSTNVLVSGTAHMLSATKKGTIQTYKDKSSIIKHPTYTLSAANTVRFLETPINPQNPTKKYKNKKPPALLFLSGPH